MVLGIGTLYQRNANVGKDQVVIETEIIAKMLAAEGSGRCRRVFGALTDLFAIAIVVREAQGDEEGPMSNPPSTYISRRQVGPRPFLLGCCCCSAIWTMTFGVSCYRVPRLSSTRGPMRSTTQRWGIWKRRLPIQAKTTNTALQTRMYPQMALLAAPEVKPATLTFAPAKAGTIYKMRKRTKRTKRAARTLARGSFSSGKPRDEDWPTSAHRS